MSLEMPRLPFDDDPADFQPLVEIPDPRRGTVDERATRFHAANPHIYRLLARYARQTRQAGARHYGIRALWEVLRWRSLTTRGDVYKLNDHYTRWYAREIMQREADLAEFFEIRDRHDADYYRRPVRP